MTPHVDFPWAGLSIMLALGLVSLAIYFLPTIVAFRRRHVNRLAILICNAIFGWTMIGWGLTLVWAFTNSTLPRHTKLNFSLEAGQ